MHNISILISLFGVPLNHSSFTCIYRKHTWTPSFNFALILSALNQIMERYHDQPHFAGIEIMNAPNKNKMNPSVLVQFYLQAYHIIRSHSLSIIIVIHETSRWWISLWRQQLQEPIYYNVAMDLHLFLSYRSLRSDNYSEFLHDVGLWKTLIDMERAFKPVIIGAWSFVPYDGNSSMISQNLKQRVVHEEILAMSFAVGSYIWTWKFDRNDHEYDECSLKIQLSYEDGLRSQ